jgi:hypothetical protein
MEGGEFMPEEEEVKGGLNRRQFIRRAAVTGAAVAWAVPVIQTVTASPASAQTLGDFSACNGACNGTANKGTCTGVTGGTFAPNTGCQSICAALCGGPGGICCTPDALDPSKFCVGSADQTHACYFGATCGTAAYNTTCCGGKQALCYDGTTKTTTCACT